MRLREKTKKLWTKLDENQQETIKGGKDAMAKKPRQIFTPPPGGWW